MQETRQVAHAVMNLRMHEFMGDDINALTFRADHDASTAANELGAAVGIEPNRALKNSASLAAFSLSEKSNSNERLKPAALPL